MQTDFFLNKRVTVMGLGLLGGGLGTVQYLLKHGARVTVTDLRTEIELHSSLVKLQSLPVRLVLGQHVEKDFVNADLVIQNPSVPPHSPFLAIARSKNIPIEMAESLFVKLSPTRNIIGVTGTRGKSTTSTLIYQLLKQAGKDVYLAGNTKGASTLGLLDQVTADSAVVLELSSWQLASFGEHKLSPHIAVITNLYPDHLNRYDDMDSYIADKKNIYLFQHADDVVILNKDNPASAQFTQDAKSRLVWFAKSDVPSNMPFALPGMHNLENAAAAFHVAQELHIDFPVVTRVFASFHTLPQRLEEISNVGGIRVINDSTSTTPIATITAFNAFPEDTIILIVGGNSKNLPIDEMVDVVAARAKAVVLLDGTGTEAFAAKLRNRLSDLGKKTPMTDILTSLKDAVTSAYGSAQPGDVILLSPGFTSFGMFKNEFERGERWNYEVQAFHTRNRQK